MNRSPNGVNIRRFLEGYGVKVHLYRESKTPRPANVVYGGRQIGRLIKKNPDRAALTIRCIQTSNPTCFDDVTVWSVWCFLATHFPRSSSTAAIKAFSHTDLVLLRHKFVDFSGHCPGAAWTSLKAATECDGQVPSDGGDRIWRVSLGSDRGIRGVDNLRER
jgi:hypothetical protein